MPWTSLVSCFGSWELPRKSSVAPYFKKSPCKVCWMYCDYLSMIVLSARIACLIWCSFVPP